MDRSAALFPERPRASSHSQMPSGFSLSDVPAGFLKGISSDHLGFAETRKGAPTNWAGTPDGVDVDPHCRFAKCLVGFSCGFSQDSPAKRLPEGSKEASVSGSG